MQLRNWPSCYLLLTIIALKQTKGADDDYNVLRRDGSYEFGYETPDSYHHADATRNNVVRGEFGSRNPTTGGIDSTVYTAGPRGFRPRGKNVVRKYDLNQNGPRPIGSRDDPYYDPFEDPSYNFAFRTRTYSRQENANRVGDVTGKYTYLDDVGERHNVEFVAGKNTGFHVKTPYPDSNPRAFGPLYFNGRGKPIPRGRTSIQRGLDGSYRFVSAGPDQRRSETSDSTGHVRGSYTYLDDKGVQHSVHYIAGPETGYRVLKNVKGPHLPTVFPFGRPEIIPSDFYDYTKDTGDLFDTAASGHVKPANSFGGSGSSSGSDGGAGSKPSDKDNIPSFDNGIDVNMEELDNLGKPGGGNKRPGGGSGGGGRPPSDGGFNRPTYEQEDSESDFGSDLFGGPSASTPRPGGGGGSVSGGGTDPYKPSADDGAYVPSRDDGSYKPGPDETGLGDSGGLPRPGLGGPPTSGRPAGTRPQRPNYDYDGNDVSDGDFGLFGSETNSRPPLGGGGGGGSTTGGGKPVIQISGQGGGPSGPSAGCDQCKGTIVTNVGDKLFSVPPGVSVRAHVQAIDLLPLLSKVPSPSEQFNADMNIKTEQLNSAASDVVVSTTTAKENSDLTTTSSFSTTPTPTTSTLTTLATAQTTAGSTGAPSTVTTTISSTTDTTEDSDPDIF